MAEDRIEGVVILVVKKTLSGTRYSKTASVEFRDQRGKMQELDVTLIPEEEQRQGATHRDENGVWYAGLAHYD